MFLESDWLGLSLIGLGWVGLDWIFFLTSTLLACDGWKVKRGDGLESDWLGLA